MRERGLLHCFDHLPEGLLHCDPADLHRHLPGPSLIHLPGRRTPPLFVSVLLHGNERTGFQALQDLLRHYGERPLPRALSFFIGNVAAAREGCRRLPGQPDYNRIWQGGGAPEHAMAQAVVAEMAERGIFASVDIHNNSGLNPHYACVNRLEPRFFHLATLFSRTVVYFLRPEGVQSAAFAPLGPAVTVECGQSDARRGREHALAFLEACLQMNDLPDHPIHPGDMDLYHTVAVVKVPEGVRFDFAGVPEGDVELSLLPDLDHYNFCELPARTLLGRLAPGSQVRLEVTDEQGREVAARYLDYRDGEIYTRVPTMPTMLTVQVEAVRQDCLGYLMERMSLP